MTAIQGNDILDDILLHLTLYIRIVNHTEEKRKHIRRHGIVAVERAVGIQDMSGNSRRTLLHLQEFLVESLFRQGSLLLEIVGIGCQTLYLGKLLHQQTDAIVISRRDQSTVGDTRGILTVYHLLFLWWHTPVAITVFRDQSVFLILVLQVLHPALHCRIMLLHRSLIAILVVQHLQRERQCCRPGNVIRIVVPVSRSYIGNRSILILCLFDITHPLTVQGVVIQDKGLAIASTGAVA